MIKNRFFLRILGLAAVSGLSLLCVVPEATAQTDSSGQDFFCDRGTQVSGFPFNLFPWDAIPWGIERKEFLERYKEQIKACDWEVDKKGKVVLARYRDPGAKKVYGEEQVVAQVKFSFYGEDKTLSRVEIYDARSIASVADRLSQQFGNPQEATYFGDPNPNIQSQQRIYKGIWSLPDTKTRAISSWRLVFEPLSIKELL